MNDLGRMIVVKEVFCTLELNLFWYWGFFRLKVSFGFLRSFVCVRRVVFLLEDSISRKD